jgi:hypothetical protein
MASSVSLISRSIFRRRASRLTSSITGSDPYFPVPIIKRLHLQGSFSSNRHRGMRELRAVFFSRVAFSASELFRGRSAHRGYTSHCRSRSNRNEASQISSLKLLPYDLGLHHANVIFEYRRQILLKDEDAKVETLACRNFGDLRSFKANAPHQSFLGKYEGINV